MPHDEGKAIWQALHDGAVVFSTSSKEHEDPVGRLALVEVTGEDRLEWLQGQVTNDLRGLRPGDHVDFCMLKPTGQIAADCRMWVLEDRCVIVTPKLCVPALLKRFEDLVILEDVEARDRSGTFGVILVQGPKAGKALAKVEGTLTLPSDRSGFGGYEIWVERGEPHDRALAALAGLPIGNSQALLASSLLAGFPHYGLDVDDKTLLPEMGPAFTAKNVSYTKGCYTGQEIVARIHSRGHTNRTWVALLSEEPLVPGAAVAAARRPDAGRVTRTAHAPALGHISGAILRNEVAEEGAEVTVLLEDRPVPAKVRRFPITD